jgi:predicted RNA-binding protein YlqC (UPF0109 family)
MTDTQIEAQAPDDTARDILHALVQPLMARDPTGVYIRTSPTRNEITLFATPTNMGPLIGRNGQMVRALRRLIQAFGWRLDVPGQARTDISTPTLDPLPSVKDLVEGWLEARYSAAGYKFTADHDPKRDEWTVFVHPDHYDHEDHAALEAWAYGAAKAQGGRLKVQLKQGGLVHG